MRRFLPRGLFGKYALTIVGVVVLVLVVNGVIEAYIIYTETKARLAQMQHDAAKDVVNRTEALLADLERRASFVTRASSMTLAGHRQDYLALLQASPDVVDVTFVTADGQQRLLVARDRVLLGTELKTIDPATIEPRGRFAWVSPVAIEKASKLIAQLTMVHAGRPPDVTIASIDIAKVLSFLKTATLPPGNYAYVVDAEGKVVAASGGSPISPGAAVQLSNFGPLTANSTFASLTHRERGDPAVIATAAPIASARWFAVIEQPTRDALRPLADFALRLVWLLAFGLALAILASLILTRRMIEPIRALREGATHLAANEFDRRIEVKTGDEIEDLAEQFNKMASELASSYGLLEQQVEERTRDLALSVRELKALEEVGRALASSLDLSAVLSAIVSRAVELTHADAGAVYAPEGDRGLFPLAEAHGFSPELRTSAAVFQWRSESTIDATLTTSTPTHIADLAAMPDFPSCEAILHAGFRSALVVGLIGSGRTLGALVMYSRSFAGFPSSTSGVMQTFAHQSVLAMHNARLFQELIDRGKQLEVANAHRRQFFGNMSHELRTPLNAVLGYSELLADGLYGALPERAVGVIDRIQANSKHLLGLINDVLDLTKMEAGALSLSLNDYSVKSLVENVVASTESLARNKGLTFEAHVPADLPFGHGDDRRLTQVLLNLVGNAIKFTDEGSVRIGASQVADCFHISVRDTGPGISTDGQKLIFEEFHQIDDANTRKKGGTGLGLSISNRLVMMHGGRITVESVEHEGATFTMIVPVRVEEQRSTA